MESNKALQELDLKEISKRIEQVDKMPQDIW